MKGYELKRMPTHPGEILREDFMLPHHLTQVKLARALKTTFRTINEIVNCKRSISPEMALKLARYFGTSPDIWLNLQADYDLYKAKLKSKRIIEGIKPHEKRRIAA